ncbi:YciI family protein [Sphingomonas panacisoli]|uniref:YciI family protein n=1 Tax=Sphingomonas panacisoli TaxID=1813879 RepID=A0A5B8LJM6_9SPHN|nr:YciI family protein [Sphingomonas panacisoli]QDZ07774.1 YciI family protein [Sphingomonas panacisoli]
MQYMVLIYEDEAGYGGKEDSPELKAIVAKHYALAGELGDKLVAGSGLMSVTTATTVRTAPDGSQTIHDGPFAETREQLGGFYLIEAQDLDEAIAFAKRVPIRLGGSVEVRPAIMGG